jgi:ribose-phosphate pyrophosphokinase
LKILIWWLTLLAVVEKRRLFNTGHSEALTVIGDVRDKNVLIVDDEVLSGGTIANVVEALRDQGIRDAYLAFTHAILSEKGAERLSTLGLKEIITTDTIPLMPERKLPNMKILSVAPLLGEVILRAHEGRSVGELFNE